MPIVLRPHIPASLAAFFTALTGNFSALVIADIDYIETKRFRFLNQRQAFLLKSSDQISEATPYLNILSSSSLLIIKQPRFRFPLPYRPARSAAA